MKTYDIGPKRTLAQCKNAADSMWSLIERNIDEFAACVAAACLVHREAYSQDEDGYIEITIQALRKYLPDRLLAGCSDVEARKRAGHAMRALGELQCKAPTCDPNNLKERVTVVGKLFVVYEAAEVTEDDSEGLIYWYFRPNMWEMLWRLEGNGALLAKLAEDYLGGSNDH